MGKGDRENHVEMKASVKEDLFEAITGAVALDSNWDVRSLERVIMNMLTPEAELDTKDCENHIGFVQDWSWRNMVNCHHTKLRHIQCLTDISDLMYIVITETDIVALFQNICVN